MNNDERTEQLRTLLTEFDEAARRCGQPKLMASGQGCEAAKWVGIYLDIDPSKAIQIYDEWRDDAEAAEDES